MANPTLDIDPSLSHHIPLSQLHPAMQNLIPYKRSVIVMIVHESNQVARTAHPYNLHGMRKSSLGVRGSPWIEIRIKAERSA